MFLEEKIGRVILSGEGWEVLGGVLASVFRDLTGVNGEERDFEVLK